MLNNLHIRNFRKNQNLNIELGKITTIRGGSASGKSSLVHALKWIFQNKPKSNRFITWGKKFAKVELSLDKIHTLIRKRSTSQNYYNLDGKKYEAFRNDIPETIQNLLQVSDINFQGQHDKHFWFSDTAGEVNRQLNQIVNLEVIDRTVSNLSKKQRELRIKIADTKERLELALEQKKELKYILELNEDLKKLENTENELEKTNKDCVGLTNYLDTARKYRGYIDNLRDKEVDVKSVLSKGFLLTEIKEKIEKLEDLLLKAKKYERLKDVKLPNLQCVIIKYKDYIKVKEQEELLGTLFNSATLYEDEKELSLNCLIEKKKRFKELMGKRCPLCLSKIK